MENVSIQAAQGLRAAQGLQGLLGGAAGEGGFMDLILQLMAATLDPQMMQDAMTAMSTADGEQTQGAEKQEDSDDPWMQMFASMMAAEGMTFPFMPETLTVSGAQQMAAAVQAAGGGRSADQLLSAMTSAAGGRNAEQAQGTQEDGVLMQVVQQPAAQEQAASRQEQDARDSSLMWGGRFQNLVNEAQKLMKSQGAETKPEAVDVDALQNDVNAGRFVSSEASVSKELPLPQARDVAEQVRTGILQNIDKGKNEFVVKLKPAGLGEITVHMASEGGKTVLSLIASSEQTARLLNGEMAGLRESLRPMGAEVREAVAQPQQNGAYTGYDASQQQGGQAWQQQRQAHYGQGFLDDDDGFLETTAENAYFSDGIDTYI